MAKLKKMTRKKKLFDGIWSHCLLGILAIIWLIPIVWVILTSLRASPGLISTTFFPKEYTLDNYRFLFDGKNTRVIFGTWYMNTLKVAIVNCIISTLVTLTTAYALAKFQFKSRKALMNIALVLGMFPGFMAMVAIYLILNMIDMLNTPYALVAIYAGGSGLGYYVSKGFFQTISTNLEEAAMIDGATRAQIFIRIILPLSKPIIIYTAVLAFMAPWMDYILAGILLNKPEKQTVAVGLFNLVSEQNINVYFTKFAAGCVIVALPIVLVYVLLQRFMIQGITAGSVKG